MKIFQIYFDPVQKQHCDPAFTPYNNTANPNPKLQEWLIWKSFYEGMKSGVLSEELDLWGFVSWRFKQKTNLDGQSIVDWIESNPGYDVYLINPAIVNEAVFANGWEQGEYYHPGISATANKFLSNAGYADYNVNEVLLDRTRMGFATYFVATRKFWDGYMAFSNLLFTQAEQDPKIKQEIFGDGLSGYSRDASLPMFAFINERLVGTYMDLQESKVLAYQYTADTVADKYQPYFGDISALSNLKVLINQYESDELYTIWNHYRHKFLGENPEILNLE